MNTYTIRSQWVFKSVIVMLTSVLLALLALTLISLMIAPRASASSLWIEHAGNPAIPIAGLAQAVHVDNLAATVPVATTSSPAIQSAETLEESASTCLQVWLAGGARGERVVRTTLAELSSLFVWVQGPTGSSVPAQVRLMGPNGEVALGNQCVTDTSGQATLFGSLPEGLAPGRYELTLVSDGHVLGRTSLDIAS